MWYSYCLMGKNSDLCNFFFFLRTFIFTKQNLLSKCPKTDLLSLSLPSYDLYILLVQLNEVEHTVFHGVGRADDAGALHFTDIQTGTVLLLPLDI